MKKINKLFLCLSLFISLSFAGCATASKSQLKPAMDPVEWVCSRTCKLMADCKAKSTGQAYSKHDLLLCGRECYNTPPILRDAVAECSGKWLVNCEYEEMSKCVNNKLAPYRQE